MNVAVLVSFHSPASLYFLQYQVSILEKRMPFELLKRVDARPSRASSRPKTFPEVPTIFSVSCGNTESRQGMVLGLGTVGR